MSKKNFQKFLEENNIDIAVLESEEKTHTAKQAADAHGVSVRNIVKSILVRMDGEFFLFLVPGDKQIDLNAKKEQFKSAECRIANANEVKNITGYSIGGVPPFGHREKISTYIEEGFDENEFLLAAAGAPNCVFKIKLSNLKEILDTLA